MAKVNWNTGDIITEEKMDLIETKLDRLLNTVNSLVGVVRGLKQYINEDDNNDIIGLEGETGEEDIGYNSPQNAEISAGTNFENLINEIITQRINKDWPSNSQLLINGDNTAVGTEGINDGESQIVSVSALQDYIDHYFDDKYNDTLEMALNNIRNASEQYYNKYAIGDILITTTTHEIEENDLIIGNSLTTLATSGVEGVYWVPFGQGRMLIGAGAGTDINNYTMEFPQKINENIILEGGEYIHTLTINEIPSHEHKLSNSDIKFISSWSKTGDTGTSKNICVKSTNMKNLNTVNAGGGQSHNNLPPYIVVYFYKCCDEEEYNTYYNVEPVNESVEESPVETENP